MSTTAQPDRPTPSSTQRHQEKSFLQSSIQRKFLLICLLLIVVMAASISAVYLSLTRRDKRQESQRRIQVAFDIVLHDMAAYSESFARGADDFLRDSLPIREATSMSYEMMGLHDADDIVRTVARGYLVDVATDLEKFAHIVRVHRLVLYGPDASIMAMYQLQDGEEVMGLSTISDAGNQTFLRLDDPGTVKLMLDGDEPVPDALFPFGVQTHFFGDIPDATTVSFFTEDRKLGLRITAPIAHGETGAGVLVGDIFFTQRWIQQFADLSTTDINLFVGDQFSIGSFPEQESLPPGLAADLAPRRAAEMLRTTMAAHDVRVSSTSIKDEPYYYGACALLDDGGGISTLGIGVSQVVEQQEIRSVLGTILIISGIAIVVAIVFSFILSHRTMQTIRHLVHVIGAAASGNLQRTALVRSYDEFGLLAVNINEMIMRLRDVSTQTQAVAHTVTLTSSDILQEVDSLAGLMEQQAGSVENTVEAVERIDGVIDGVVGQITDLLTGTEQILAALHRMSATSEAVADSTGYLKTDVQEVSNFIEQVEQASRQILTHADRLASSIEETEAATNQINALLVNVADDAEQAQHFATETAEAALDGQTAVERAIDGIDTLKQIVEASARIMYDVNQRSEQVSTILNIVDDVTDKTTLLSLNAAIISAQAGEHGRGFAVVADEIRELADQTRASTHEIGDLIHALQRHAAEGVRSVSSGIAKADEGVQLARDVNASLQRINQWATRSSERAKHTAQAVRESVTGSQAIQDSMHRVMEMMAGIRQEIEREEHNLSDVVASIENIQVMSAQVKEANDEQNSDTQTIEARMREFTRELTGISDQARNLQQNSDQIVDAMRRLGTITDTIVRHTTTMSEHTVTRLVHQSDALREGLNVFRAA